MQAPPDFGRGAAAVVLVVVDVKGGHLEMHPNIISKVQVVAKLVILIVAIDILHDSQAACECVAK